MTGRVSIRAKRASDVAAENVAHSLQATRHSQLKFICLNGLAIYLFAVFHNFMPERRIEGLLDDSRYYVWIGAEVVALFLPSLLVAMVAEFTRGLVSKFAGVFCRLLTMAISALYFVDFSLVVNFREHLISHEFRGLIEPILPTLHRYVSTSHVLNFFVALIAWSAGQLLFWSISKRQWFSQQKNRKANLSLSCLFGAMNVALVLHCLSPALRDTENAWRETITYAERHPITACGLFPASHLPAFEQATVAAVQGAVFLLDHPDFVDQFVDRYNNLKTVSDTDDQADLSAGMKTDADQYPDIMLMISECLRPDAVTAKTAPHLYRIREKGGIRSEQHFSEGNCTPLGFFGVMYGTDACWYESNAVLKTGLLPILKEIGYETAFFGVDDFTPGYTGVLCAPSQFDFSKYSDRQDEIHGDQLACQAAQDFFQRRGEYQQDHYRPRVAVVYQFGPHSMLHTKEVKVFTHQDAERFPNYFPATYSRSVDKFSQYLNSIHCLDRNIAPLSDESRLTFILGDHGESYGEDRRISHSSALSRVQLQTYFHCFGPRVLDRDFKVPTSHFDVMPTILDLLGIEVSDPGLLAGSSLLRPLPANRVIACRLGLRIAMHSFLRICIRMITCLHSRVF